MANTMKKHREEEEEGEGSSERWLLTYSDLITLLLALFIILYTMSSVDLDKLKELSKNLKESFNGSTSGTATNGSGSGNIDDKPSTSSTTTSSNNATSSTTTTGELTGEKSTLDEIYKEIYVFIHDNNFESKIDLVKTRTELKITLKDTIIFVPDSPVMLPASEPILLAIDKSLSKVYDRIDHITISGHTADVDNEGNKSSEFAWELSTNRAVTVLNFLEKNGLFENKLSIEGYSHFKPIAKNDTEANRSKNRRVEITIRKDAVNKTK